ncbi:MAG: Gfo/Idh/MocA family oxidoreductase [Gammaproteobacteria bacterium]|nr:UDP-N-acetyl-D-glucosamine dehydrogenase [Gammaproteobacteria bacterium]
MSKVRAAVVGTGYLGRFHAEKYAALPNAELVGVCDIDERAGRAVAEALGVAYFPSHADLVGRVDAVTIAATTSAHYELAKYFLEHGVHVFVEKPMTRTAEEARELTELAERKSLKLQVGHVERFNPALLSARESLTDIDFIECHRLAPFKGGRGADVDVVRDLMIHDLDVMLSLVASAPREIAAVGIGVLTDTIDIANARIEFESGAIANVTASRVSTSAQRRFRVFQQNQYVSIDFGNGEVRRVIAKPGAPADEALEIERWSLEKGDALLAETRSFVDAILDDRPCVVSGRDGMAALELAEAIVADIYRRAARRRAKGTKR